MIQRGKLRGLVQSSSSLIVGSAAALCLVFCAAATADDTDFLRGLFRVQFDHHLREKQFIDSDPSAEITLEACIAALGELKPGSVNVFALGHEGWARFPSAVFPPHPALTKDTLALWREACDRTGTPLYVYVSSLINFKLNHEHPEFARLFSNHNPANERLDHNSQFVDRLLIPFLKEIVGRYRPDGVWLDGDYWSVFPSWNPASLAGFEQSTGRKAPLNFADPAFPRFWEYTLQSHEQYVQRLGEAIRAVKGDCGLVVNSGYTLRQPRPPPPFIARVNLDVPTYYGLEVACLESHYQASRPGLPFDIVVGSHTEPEGAPYAYSKPAPHLTQEIATILANGGGLSLYVPMTLSGGFDLDELRRFRALLADFCVPRKAALVPSRSAANVAVLHCASHFARTHSLDDVRGAALALLRSNVPFDIVDDAAFCADHGRFAAVLLPNSNDIPPQLAAALEGFVKTGGALLSSLSPDGREAGSLQFNSPLIPFAATDAAFVAAPVVVNGPFGPFGVDGFVRLTPRSSVETADCPIESASGGSTPARFIYPVGRGRVALFGAPVFAAFDRAADPSLRKFIGDSLDRVLANHARLAVLAPPWIEVVYRTAGPLQIVHLVNHARGAEFRPRTPAVEQIPPCRNISITLPLAARPSSVECVPADVHVEWTWEAGLLKIVVDRVDVHCACLVAPSASGAADGR